MRGDDPILMRPPIQCWLTDACAHFCLRDKEVAAYLHISLSLWRKIRHGERTLQYAQRRRFRLLLQSHAEPAEYARWIAAEPPMHAPPIRRAS